ncbi:hypothetical protein DVH24_001586 [Malus domestica]|uniref:Uncharacterized protein n=1 Tax=Malus domestica TaxID=3750 RepID=A0A498K7M3_MALDO|nr:hypothetical protein DVH24_001586 [Malus domestica]
MTVSRRRKGMEILYSLSSSFWCIFARKLTAEAVAVPVFSSDQHGGPSGSLRHTRALGPPQSLGPLLFTEGLRPGLTSLSFLFKSQLRLVADFCWLTFESCFMSFSAVRLLTEHQISVMFFNFTIFFCSKLRV